MFWLSRICGLFFFVFDMRSILVVYVLCVGCLGYVLCFGCLGYAPCFGCL